MKKLWNIGLLAALLAFGGFLFGVAEQGALLHENLIRLHVVANSDSEADQAVKLRVRDAITDYLAPVLAGFESREEAEEYLQAHLSDLQRIANEVLARLGSRDTAVVTLALEEFPKRIYDTFSLPSGVYESLRIRIGNAQGQNWWCVVFPQLCLPATSEGFDVTAAAAGFPESLTEALQGDNEIRFFFLDCLGQLENFFFE